MIDSSIYGYIERIEFLRFSLNWAAYKAGQKFEQLIFNGCSYHEFGLAVRVWEISGANLAVSVGIAYNRINQKFVVYEDNVMRRNAYMADSGLDEIPDEAFIYFYEEYDIENINGAIMSALSISRQRNSEFEVESAEACAV